MHISKLNPFKLFLNITDGQNKMIRWYDYIFAFIVANLIVSIFFVGITATEFWQSLLSGALIGFLLRFWESGYCQFRLTMEKHGQ